MLAEHDRSIGRPDPPADVPRSRRPVSRSRALICWLTAEAEVVQQVWCSRYRTGLYDGLQGSQAANVDHMQLSQS